MNQEPNTSNLNGIRCPKCGSYEPFDITMEVTYTTYDRIPSRPRTGRAWTMDSDIKCSACGHAGIMGEFQQNRTAGEIMHLEGEEGEGRATCTNFSRDFGMRTSNGNEAVALFVCRALESIEQGRVGNSRWLAAIGDSIKMIHGVHPEITSVTVRDHIFNALAPAYRERYKVSLPYDAIMMEAKS